MYVIVGANGFLGSYILRALTAEAREDVWAVGVHVSARQDGDGVRWIKCDVTEPEEVLSLSEAARECAAPVNVIYLAALHHPDRVEAEPRLAWDINVTALSRFLNRFWFARRFIYVSTDSVYGEGGLTRRFREGDPPDPVNRYGVQKVVAEALVRGYGFQVVRLPFLIGPSLVPGRMHFYDQIVRTVTSGKPMEMFTDAYRSTLSFQQAAGFIAWLSRCEGEIPTLLNVCGDEALSKYEVGLRIARRLGAPEGLIVPIEMACGGIFAVKRASTTIMDNGLLKRTLGIRSVFFEL